jgi:hypothetical protein
MGERADQIEQNIRHERDVLENNFSELEQKVKNAFDWHSQFEEHPGVMLGLAFAGGALVAAVLPSGSSITSRVTSRRRSFNDLPTPNANRETASPSFESEEAEASGSSPAYKSYTDSPSASTARSSETWENLRNAAVSLATARLTEYIENIVPGFSEHYKRASSGKPATPYSSMPSSGGTHSASGARSWQKPNGSDYASHS